MRSVHESNIRHPETSEGPFFDGPKKGSELSKSVSNARQLVSNQEALLTSLQKLRKELTLLDWEASSLRYDVGIHHCSRLPDPKFQTPVPTRLGAKPPIGPSRERGRSVTRRNSFSSRTSTTSRSQSVSRNSSASELFSDNSADHVHGCVPDNPGDRSPRTASPFNRDCLPCHPKKRSRSRRRVTLSGGIQTEDVLSLDQNSVSQPTHFTDAQMTYDHTSLPDQLISTPRSRRWSYVENPE